METHDIPDACLDRLRQLQQRMQDITMTLMHAKGLDPQQAEVDLQQGIITHHNDPSRRPREDHS